MAGTFVQSNGNDNDTGGALTVTLGSAPTEGNLILVFMLERNDEPTSDSMTTAGYTKIDYNRLYTADGTHRRGCAIYYKFAGASESATITGTYTPALGNSIIYAVEYSNVGAYRSNFGYSDNGNVLNETVFTSSTLTTSANSTIIAATFYKGQATTPSPTNLSVTYSNGFSAADAYAGAYNYTFTIGSGIVDKASAGSYSTVSTLASNNTDNRDITNVLIEFASDVVAPVGIPEYARVLCIS